ncbi:hypothetical protein MCW_01016 [Cardidatus Bartonella washoeensis 085-0475]|uniref:Uncharacterized protein n=1 Tax=Cardidatus Bartonella washoeensis 085-0475 TaxID=1094564 RepID=J1JLJ3_9HYPH|nr:hypothetical protein MCW_01016 [Bartonella washoeensis 085-0475]
MNHLNAKAGAILGTRENNNGSGWYLHKRKDDGGIQ